MLCWAQLRFSLSVFSVFAASRRSDRGYLTTQEPQKLEVTSDHAVAASAPDEFGRYRQDTIDLGSRAVDHSLFGIFFAHVVPSSKCPPSVATLTCDVAVQVLLGLAGAVSNSDVRGVFA